MVIVCAHAELAGVALGIFRGYDYLPSVVVGVEDIAAEQQTQVEG